MVNKEIAGILKYLAKLMELHGENGFKIKSYNSAAFRIERHSVQLTQLSDSELSEIPGIGKSIILKIRLILDSGTLPEIENILANTPEGVIEVMNIKGIGPKKTGKLWTELGVESPRELLYACNENRLVSLKGFG